MSIRKEKIRCSWVPLDKPDYVAYHDHEWGRPVHDDRLLFEMLILEGAQAGLSWYTILQRRAAYRRAFYEFDPVKVAHLSDAALERILVHSGVIRNRLKVFSVRANARIFLTMQAEFGSFAKYLWTHVDDRPVVNRPRNAAGTLTSSDHAIIISKDLKKRGMRFVGPTIIYAYLQAVGVVNDHQRNCYLCP